MFCSDKQNNQNKEVKTVKINVKDSQKLSHSKNIRQIKKSKEIEITLALYDKAILIKASGCNAEELFTKLPKELSFEVTMDLAFVFSNYLEGNELGLSDKQLNKVHIGKLLRLPDDHYEWWEYGYPPRLLN